MASGGDPKTTSPMPFDPSVWMEAQRRNVEAFASAGRIVADGMRAVAERQAAMVQDAMSELWGEMQAASKGAAAGGAQQRGAQAAGRQPQEQLERMRAAFDRVTGQFQEMSGVLLKAQGQAMEVLNACAAANMQDLGKMAPDLAAMQKAAADAIQAATAQATAAVEEMRRRMGELERETRSAMADTGGKAGAAPASASAASEAPKRTGGGGGKAAR